MQITQRRFGTDLAFFLLSLVAGFGLNMRAADWPQWRGINREDICTETGLLKQWPQGGPRLVWKAKGLGSGFSTVSVVGDRLYTTGQSSDSSSVVAVKAADGALVWSAKLGKASSPGGYVGPRSEPAVAGDSVYALGQSGDLICVDSAAGTERWRKQYVKDFGGTEPQWGFSEAPLVDGDKIIITPGGRDGTRKYHRLFWKSEPPHAIAGAPSGQFPAFSHRARRPSAN